MSDLPTWLIIKRDEARLLMPVTDLAHYLEETHEDSSNPEEIIDQEIDLLELPSKRKQLAPISSQATLQQALKILEESDAEALYVIKPLGSSADKIFGIVTRQMVEEEYRYRT